MKLLNIDIKFNSEKVTDTTVSTNVILSNVGHVYIEAFSKNVYVQGLCDKYNKLTSNLLKLDENVKNYKTISSRLTQGIITLDQELKFFFNDVKLNNCWYFDINLHTIELGYEPTTGVITYFSGYDIWSKLLHPLCCDVFIPEEYSNNIKIIKKIAVTTGNKKDFNKEGYEYIVAVQKVYDKKTPIIVKYFDDDEKTGLSEVFIVSECNCIRRKYYEIPENIKRIREICEFY